MRHLLSQLCGYADCNARFPNTAIIQDQETLDWSHDRILGSDEDKTNTEWITDGVGDRADLGADLQRWRLHQVLVAVIVFFSFVFLYKTFDNQSYLSFNSTKKSRTTIAAQRGFDRSLRSFRWIFGRKLLGLKLFGQFSVGEFIWSTEIMWLLTNLGLHRTTLSSKKLYVCTKPICFCWCAQQWVNECQLLLIECLFYLTGDPRYIMAYEQDVILLPTQLSCYSAHQHSRSVSGLSVNFPSLLDLPVNLAFRSSVTMMLGLRLGHDSGDFRCVLHSMCYLSAVYIWTSK